MMKWWNRFIQTSDPFQWIGLLMILFWLLWLTGGTAQAGEFDPTVVDLCDLPGDECEGPRWYVIYEYRETNDWHRILLDVQSYHNRLTCLKFAKATVQQDWHDQARTSCISNGLN